MVKVPELTKPLQQHLEKGNFGEDCKFTPNMQVNTTLPGQASPVEPKRIQSNATVTLRDSKGILAGETNGE